MELVNRFNQGVDFDALYQKDVAIQYCVLSALKNAKGHEYRITRAALVRKVQLLWYWRISNTDKPPGDRKIRNTIRELRREGALICSTGGRKGGYWIPETLAEVMLFIATEFVARALDMLVTAKRMKDAAIQIFGGQKYIWDNEIIKKVNDIICV